MQLCGVCDYIYSSTAFAMFLTLGPRFVCVVYADVGGDVGGIHTICLCEKH